MADGIHDRRQYSVERLEDLNEVVRALDDVIDPYEVCIYVTGSYGRLEAWDGSDIDVFFLGRSGAKGSGLPRLRQTKLMAGLIAGAEQLSFPEFSQDGRWLEVHYVDEMAEILGSPRDDSQNAFTARMLLLLESRPVLREHLYRELLDEVVAMYFRDFDDHPATFVPSVLNNDVLRFWRTLTLNYEAERLEVHRAEGDGERRAKASIALKNYKLKFSRLATCFSMVVNLARATCPVRPEEVIRLAGLTPQERFNDLRGCSREADRLLDDMAERYAGFLDAVQRPKQELLAELEDPKAREGLLDSAGEYGTDIFELLCHVADRDRLRYLVV